MVSGEAYGYSEIQDDLSDGEASWYYVEYSSGEFGWVSGVYVEVAEE